MRDLRNRCALVLTLPLLLTTVQAGAQPAQQADPEVAENMRGFFVQMDRLNPQKIDFAGFLRLAAEVEPYRRERLLTLDQFLEKARQPGVVILDSRSTEMYQRKHLQGAQHLNFADYNQISLYQLIPDKNTTILIYCNNNFTDDQKNFASKMSISPTNDLNGNDSYVNNISLALNIPTFINLYGYGYRNVYELGEIISVHDPRLHFAGSAVPTTDGKPDEARK